jgi:hypothetical protein
MHVGITTHTTGTSLPVKLARLRRPKIVCSPSYVDNRPKTNAVILLDMGHTLRGDLHGRDGERERKPKLEGGFLVNNRFPFLPF